MFPEGEYGSTEQGGEEQSQDQAADIGLDAVGI